MNLYLLRHGVAEERGAPGYDDDRQRPLTSKGERKLWRITEAMRELELSFDVILSSPLVRARQTAEIAAEALDAQKKLRLCDHLTPDGDARELIKTLKALNGAVENVLLVGHEPFLSELIALLVTGSKGSAVALKKGGLCKLTVHELQSGRCASLDWLLTPRQMELMG